MEPSQDIRYAIVNNNVVSLTKTTGLEKLSGSGKWKVVKGTVSKEDLKGLEPTLENLLKNMHKLSPADQLNIMAELENKNIFANVKNPEVFKDVWDNAMAEMYKNAGVEPPPPKPEGKRRATTVAPPKHTTTEFVSKKIALALTNKDSEGFVSLYSVKTPKGNLHHLENAIENGTFTETTIEKAFDNALKTHGMIDIQDFVAHLLSLECSQDLKQRLVSKYLVRVSPNLFPSFGYGPERSFGPQIAARAFFAMYENTKPLANVREFTKILCDQAMPDSFHLLCEEPVSKEAIQKCAKITQEAQSRNIQGNGWPTKLQKQRQGCSGTLSGERDIAKQTAITNWNECDRNVSEKALQDRAKPDNQFTLNDIVNINKELKKGEASASDITTFAPGTLRVGMAGNDKNVVQCANGAFLPPHSVNAEMVAFVKWLNKEMKACHEGKQDPIVVAALAYQELVSIHPFHDGNGRTSQMVMDYVLQRFGLPPALIKPEDFITILTTNPDKSASPDKAVNVVREGVERALTYL